MAYLHVTQRPERRHPQRREVAFEDEVEAGGGSVDLAARVEAGGAQVVEVDVEGVIVRVLVVREDVLRPPDVRVVDPRKAAEGHRAVDGR